MYEDSKIIAMARSMGKILQTEPEYLNFHLARKASDEDEVLQDLIGKFQLLQLNMEKEMSSEQPAEDKVQQLSDELEQCYGEIMGNSSMMEYERTRAELEGLMQFVNQILVSAMNGGDPDKVTEPTPCSGNCASCGGSCG